MAVCVLVQLCVLVTAVTARHVTYNNRPVIGVLAQATDSKTHGDTYIPANYVKYLEQAGARVVPVRVREQVTYYVKLFSQINGVLFPGGSVGIVSSDYAKAARILYDMAVKANDAGDHFPLWGTCQGFQLLTNLTARHNLLQPTDAENISLPLDLTPDAKSSRLLGRLSQKTLHILTTENVTPNFHHYGLLLETFNQTKSLTSFYRPISTNRGRKGKVFVSTIEAFKYPFYGTQWHPEVINFDWNPKQALDHTSNGVLISHYFSSFFINEARLSGHKFPNVQAAADAVIENFHVNYQNDGTFMETYYLNYTKSYP
ncbi:gamma-glutamyl hydrolase A-like isoform X2 [Haliotis rubra]|uniref:gamma-glutamyl hydrolase A-like isoform X2 n=1 Tax=Haliotis rubra TaxID=36100 RepID=UPI001EE5123A|nr:gamma-glutamyl hydrolase A-like isoform X2 [Haliotis rubra]